MTVSKTISFQALVDELEVEPDREIAYEWSNGRQFFEPFRLQGYGSYEDIVTTPTTPGDALLTAAGDYFIVESNSRITVSVLGNAQTSATPTYLVQE
jgi:hypothetical protein